MPNTPNNGWNMPTEFADSDTWGGELNALFILMDAFMYALATARNYATAGGTADVLTLTTATPANALVDGQEYRFKASGTNTTAMTLNPDGLGATAIKYADGSAIPAGGVISGRQYVVTYSSTLSAFVLAASGISPATAAETLAGTDAVKFLTAAGFAGNKSLATDGYFRFPGGFTLQWGTSTANIAGGSTFTATFPVAFANACVFAIATPRNPAGGLNEDIQGLQWKAVSTTTASFFCQDGSQNANGANWFAVGY